MKKLFLMSALVSIIASSTMVFATNLTKSDETEISYTIDEGYVLTIPADLELVTESPDENKLSVTNVRLAANESLTITMASVNYNKVKTDAGYQVVYDSTSYIPYTVMKGATGAVETEVTENNHELINIDAGATEAEIYLTFTTTDDDILGATKAGKHIDTLTFTAEVK